MGEINERIKKVVEASNLTKTAFGETINVSQQHVSRLTMSGNPSDRTIKDICDKFHVNEDWLRYGIGEMFEKRTRADEIATFMGDLLDSPPSFKQRLVSVLASLSEDQWELLEEMAVKLAEEAKEKPGQGPGDGQGAQ